MPRMIEVDPVRMHRAARQLSNDGIWIKREFWVDEHTLEVPEGDPSACNRGFGHEIDYDRIVTLVVEHLAEQHPDWIADPALASEIKLAHFLGLNPQPTRGPTDQEAL